MHQPARPLLTLALLFAGALMLAPGAHAAPPAPPAPVQAPAPEAHSRHDGRWHGVISTQLGIIIEFFVTLKTDPATGAQSATIDIPMQAIAAAPLSNVSFSADGVSFSLAAADAVFVGAWAADGPFINGQLTQAGNTYPFEMQRADVPRPPPDAAPLAPGAERWKGYVQLPNGSLSFFVTFTPGADPDAPGAAAAHTAVIDIPTQNIAGESLCDVVLGESEIRFTLQAPGSPTVASFTLERAAADPGRAAGIVEQNDRRFAAFLERLNPEDAADAAPAPRAAPEPNAARRPQTPRPPFPYAQREVAYDAAPGVRIAGTLTIPEGPGPHPAAILVTGSGPQDRDETIAGHKPFLIIADRLARSGVAVLRVDDRGVGGSTGDGFAATTEELAADTRAGFDFLRAQPEIDPARVGVIGHSEGGAIAAMVAADSDDVAFLALLAGTGLSGADVWINQTAAMMRAAGAPRDLIRQQLRAQRNLVVALAENADDQTIRERIKSLAAAQSGATGQISPELDERLGPVVDALTPALTSPWFRSFMLHDPRESLRRVKAPVLAMAGEFDLQVPPRQNLPEIEKALRAGANEDVTILELPGLNHLFQTAPTGQPTEYEMIEETFAPDALDALTAWLRTRTGLSE